MTNAIEDFFTFALFYTYGTVMEYHYQATFGKMMMGLRVVRLDGQKPELSKSFYRNIGKLVSMIPYYYGFLRILAPHQRQTIHDELGRCLVIDIRWRRGNT